MSKAPKIPVSKSALAPDRSITFSRGAKRRLTLVGANSTIYRRPGIQILGPISQVHKSTPSRDTKGERLCRMALHEAPAVRRPSGREDRLESSAKSLESWYCGFPALASPGSSEVASASALGNMPRGSDF